MQAHQRPNHWGRCARTLPGPPSCTPTLSTAPAHSPKQAASAQQLWRRTARGQRARGRGCMAVLPTLTVGSGRRRWLCLFPLAAPRSCRCSSTCHCPERGEGESRERGAVTAVVLRAPQRAQGQPGGPWPLSTASTITHRTPPTALAPGLQHACTAAIMWPQTACCRATACLLHACIRQRNFPPHPPPPPTPPPPHHAASMTTGGSSCTSAHWLHQRLGSVPAATHVVSHQMLQSRAHA